MLQNYIPKTIRCRETQAHDINKQTECASKPCLTSPLYLYFCFQIDKFLNKPYSPFQVIFTSYFSAQNSSQGKCTPSTSRWRTKWWSFTRWMSSKHTLHIPVSQKHGATFNYMEDTLQPQENRMHDHNLELILHQQGWVLHQPSCFPGTYPAFNKSMDNCVI